MDPEGEPVCQECKSTCGGDERLPLAKGPVDTRNLTSLLTQVLFQESKIFDGRIQMDQKAAKHPFHVMIKASPEDAVLSILSADEIAILGAFTADPGYQSKLQGAISASVQSRRRAADYALGGNRLRSRVKVDDVPRTRIENTFVTALAARVAGGAQLIQPDKNDDGGVTGYFGVAGGKAAIEHSHPRPTNRIPIFTSGGDHYVVVEQRSRAHSFNGTSLPRGAAATIDAIQTPSTRSRWTAAGSRAVRRPQLAARPSPPRPSLHRVSLRPRPVVVSQ